MGFNSGFKGLKTLDHRNADCVSSFHYAYNAQCLASQSEKVTIRWT